MRRTVTALVSLAALTALLTPAEVGAYGAAHVGYTHVGPNGAYHVGATAAGGYGGARYGDARYGEVRTGTGYDRGGYAEVRTAPGGVAYGTRTYAPGYNTAHYAYVR
ncbi:MAG: hypothetical protein K2X82_25370 [Gemmataceae bacterium]|nr:hypothetical protein [Gemmataceae bacterium]